MPTFTVHAPPPGRTNDRCARRSNLYLCVTDFIFGPSFTGTAVAAVASALAGSAHLPCWLWCPRFGFAFGARVLEYPVNSFPRLLIALAYGIRGLEYLEVDLKSPWLGDTRIRGRRGCRNGGTPLLFGVAEARGGCVFGSCTRGEIFSSGTARTAYTIRCDRPVSRTGRLKGERCNCRLRLRQSAFSCQGIRAGSARKRARPADRRSPAIPTPSRGLIGSFLPGVGAFADCRRGLDEIPGMIDALEQSCAQEGGKPFFGICVGMQLMAERGL